MKLSLEPVTLDANYGDEEAVLIFRDGHLLAIASRLGPSHEDRAGHWFIEKSFGADLDRADRTFPDRSLLEEWLNSRQ